MLKADSDAQRMILAASTGGHLAQLVKIAPSLGATEDSLWITFDTEQSRSLLLGKRVLYVPYISPRDFRNIVRAFFAIRRTIRADSLTYIEAVSTGAGLALAALPAARSLGVKTRYIESVSRTDGPSVSGRILARTRFTSMQTQHRHWANQLWSFRGSVMDSYTSSTRPEVDGTPRIFVTLGTIRPYRFDAMIDAVLRTGLCNATTTWQVGCTDREELPGTVHRTMPDEDFTRNIAEADVVVTHSGVGSILKILDMGKCPVVIPRKKSRNEHVDDHQQQIARLVSDAGIGMSVDANELHAESLIRATGIQVKKGANVSKLG